MLSREAALPPHGRRRRVLESHPRCTCRRRQTSLVPLPLQYVSLFSMNRVPLVFTTGALDAIASQAYQRNTGARGLRSILEGALRDAMFEVPSLLEASAGARHPAGRPAVHRVLQATLLLLWPLNGALL